MKISIWLYEDDSCRDFNATDNVSNFRVFKAAIFENETGLLIYPKKYKNIKMDDSCRALLKQNRRIFERLGNHKAIKYLESNS